MRWAKSHKNFRLVEIPLARFSNSKIQKQKFEDTKKKKEKFERHEKNGDNGDINGKCHLHDEISIYPQNFTSSQIYPRIYHRVVLNRLSPLVSRFSRRCSAIIASLETRFPDERAREREVNIPSDLEYPFHWKLFSRYTACTESHWKSTLLLVAKGSISFYCFLRQIACRG